ncbi:MAG: hypothetical protein KDI71_20700, partial [Xanthomonadales bacterium]|nr:hypothetical protein [Xanthomonadales bacterium]
SAAALGADLQRWRLGQPVLAMGGGRAYAVSCFLRRYRWASAAAAVALLALVVGIGAALFGLGQARHAQSVAEQRRVQAENLVEVMLGDLADNLRPLGKLDLLETVGEEAMRYLSEADKTDGQAAGAVTRARALITLGEVYLARSQQQKASVAFAQSAQVLDHADTEREERRALDQEKARTAYFLGYLAFLAGDYALAERHWLRRSELSEQLQQSESNEATILESAQALHNLATLALQQGQTDLALGRFERSVALKRQAFALSPSGDDARFALANSLSSIGTTLQAQGQPGQALRYFQQQVALLADVTADDHSISWQDRIGVAKRLQGRLEFDLSGDDDGLLAAAVNHLQAAAEADPNNRVNARSLLAAQSDLAWTRFLGGEADAGLSYLQSAIEGYRRPGESEFDNPTLSTLVRAYTRLTLIAAVTSNDRYWELATAQLQMLLEAAPEGWTESGFGYSELACRDLAAALRANGPDQLQQRRDLAEQALLRLGELAQMTELSPISLYALAAKLLGDEEQVDAALRRIESLGYDAAATRRLLTQD